MQPNSIQPRRSTARPSWPKVPGLAFGGDYNPEQWPFEIWQEDMRLMNQAGVNIVTVGVFSWSRIQPKEETWDFEWLDKLFDLLHQNSIYVDLGTATASPPPWLTSKHLEILPVTSEGAVQWPGGRQHWRPTSPIFRKYALALVRKLAERYGDHPGLVAWHVNNELGCHNHFDYSDDAARAFRSWLRARYVNDITALNAAWETVFWSQEYGSFDEIIPLRSRPKGTWPNPAAQMDWRRFSSDALLDYYKDERDILHALTPDIPVTTNFMIMGSRKKDANYVEWAKEMDFLSNDHYVTEGGRDEVSFSASLCAGISPGKPWWLMEHSTSGVNWHMVNTPKEKGAMISESLTHLAHGADALCFFQWRQSRGGGERYHSSMIPHAGANSRIFKDVCRLGQSLKDLKDLRGSTMLAAEVAILFDYEAWWSSELESQPSRLLSYRAHALRWYTACLNAGVRVDVVPLGSELTNYKFIIAPMLYSVSTLDLDRLTKYASEGGALLVTYFSGVADESMHIHLGGYPGVFKDLLGIRVEEFCPLSSDVTVQLDGGEDCTTWAEPIDIIGDNVEIIRKYNSWWFAGLPAITRRRVGDKGGTAVYVSTDLKVHGILSILPDLLEQAGINSAQPEEWRGRVEHTIRAGSDGQSFWHFLLNRSDGDVDLGKVSRPAIVSTGADNVLERNGVVVWRAEKSLTSVFS